MRTLDGKKDNETEKRSLTFQDVLLVLKTQRRRVDWGIDGFHPDDHLLEAGETVSTHISAVKKLFVNGTRGGSDEPYCGGLFKYWKEVVGDLKNYPITYSNLPLYHIRLPANVNKVPDHQDMLEYLYRTSNNYPNDIQLIPEKSSSHVMFKSKGYSSGVVMINKKIYLVSLPLVGMHRNGELLFSVRPNKNGKQIVVAPGSIGLIGQEFKFSSSLERILIKLFKK